MNWLFAVSIACLLGALSFADAETEKAKARGSKRLLFGTALVLFAIFGSAVIYGTFATMGSQDFVLGDVDR